jgi:hypothetical protein
MKSVIKIILAVFLFLFVGLILGTHVIQAAAFSQLSVKLDRLKISTQTGGTVCAMTTTSAVESSVEVVFPIGFSVNTTASNWTVDTSNLPSGTTAWPGIDAATSISGQTVKFPSGNLSTSIRYCFNFSSSNTLTTKSSVGNDLKGAVSTKNSSDSLIDSSEFSLSVVQNDQTTVSATVPTKAGDYLVQLLPEQTYLDPYSQDQYIKYRIVYGSNVFSATNLTVQAEWTTGLIEDNSGQFIEIVDYQIGSATKGYNNAQPVISLADRQITWSINNFPARRTDEEVSFILKTKNTYKGSSTVKFYVTGKVDDSTIDPLEHTVQQSYKYKDSPSVIQPTSTPIPSSSQKPAASPQPSIQEIQLQNISYQDATINVITSPNSTVTIFYGTNPKNLNLSTTSLSKDGSHTLYLENLKPGINYYFRIIIKDQFGNQTSSELFTIRTALESQQPKIDEISLVVTSQNNILLSPSAGRKGDLLVIIPKDVDYEFKFALEDNLQLKTIQATVRKNGDVTTNQSVLGINSTQASEPGSDNSNALEVDNNVFVGRLKSPTEAGYYDFLIKMEDYNGNIVEQKLFGLKTIEYLKVLDSKDNRGIEKVRVLILRFNPKTKLYEILPPLVYPIKNPQYTDHQGVAEFILPEGKYKAEISRIGYKEKKVEFELGADSGSNFPLIILDREEFNIANSVKYYLNTARDFLDSTKLYLKDLAQSVRFFDLLSALTIVILLILTVLSLSAKTHIHIWDLPFYLITHIWFLFKKQSDIFIEGVVLDKDNKYPISQAQVNLIEEDSGRVISSVKTSKSGHFLLRKSNKGFKLLILKNGYEISPEIDKNDYGAKKFMKIFLKKGESSGQVYKLFIALIQKIFGFTFEVFLFLSFVFEALFIYFFGLAQTLPFIIISLINIVIWVVYLRSVKSIS